MNNKSSPKIRIALNGLGRIGRVFLRIASNNPHFEIVAAHSRGEVDAYAHLLKYDSTYGTWDKPVEVTHGHLLANGVKIPYYRAEGDLLPWKKIGVDFVLDATGRFTKRVEA